MFIGFLKENQYAAMILTLFRLYLGYEWLKSGWGKLTGGFDAKGFLLGAIQNSSGEHPAVQGWWANFLHDFAVPNVGLFNFLVPWGEFLVGLALILGLFTTFAALMATVMNFAFMFSGTTSTNPQMVLLAILILIAGSNAGTIGADRYILPIFKSWIQKRKNQTLPHSH
ncbi:DoxX family protein [Falsibacillus albus]|uniref:DoxX family protein n=1 Tax=Falsibacillus albus TaxID=2478915 RepID=A0A3L7K165_9BACI|nr:DoxX family protein [Falsibacillus albus]RLQ96129.1 DoxX family protein [Falsibacillus albus]